MINKNYFDSIVELNQTFINADPFPFVIMDNFLNPWLADLILTEAKNFKDYDYEGKWIPEQPTPNQFQKVFMPSPIEARLDYTLSEMEKHLPLTLHTLKYLNSSKILMWLSQLTGIDNLLGDDTFLGGGVHKVTSKGYLDVHTDFNLHFYKPYSRRLNLLVYLNKDWKDEYNGRLELWNSDLTTCRYEIKPIFNRAILFRTTGLSYHGHPIPLNVPDDVARYSLAVYYYTMFDEKLDEEKLLNFPKMSDTSSRNNSIII